jgi:hypothetical protein
MLSFPLNQLPRLTKELMGTKRTYADIEREFELLTSVVPVARTSGVNVRQ